MQRLLLVLHRGRLSPASPEEAGGRRPATRTSRGLSRPQRADLVTGREAGSSTHALWPQGRGASQAGPHPGQPRSSPSLLRGLPRLATQPRPLQPPRASSSPTPEYPGPTRVAAATVLTILSPGFVQSPRTPPPSSSGFLVDPPISSATNKTRSLRGTVLRGLVKVSPSQKAKRVGGAKIEAETVGSAHNIRVPTAGTLPPAVPSFPVAMLKCGMTGGQVKGGAAILVLLLRRGRP